MKTCTNKKIWGYVVCATLLMVISLFIGCAPIKRHDRLVRKYPFVHQNDTVIVRDTVRVTVPEVKIDTVFNESKLYDTIYLQKDHVKFKIWKVIGDTNVYVSGGSEKIIVEKIRNHKVPVTVYKERNPELRKALVWILIIMVGLSITNHYLRGRNQVNNS